MNEGLTLTVPCHPDPFDSAQDKGLAKDLCPKRNHVGSANPSSPSVIPDISNRESIFPPAVIPSACPTVVNEHPSPHVVILSGRKDLAKPWLSQPGPRLFNLIAPLTPSCPPLLFRPPSSHPPY
ncbi:MAG: hypothetical protein ABI618_16125, partial [Nitrospirota bacterium]